MDAMDGSGLRLELRLVLQQEMLKARLVCSHLRKWAEPGGQGIAAAAVVADRGDGLVDHPPEFAFED